MADMVFDASFENLMSKFGVKDGVKECLRANGILDSDSFQIMAATETEVKAEIIDMINGTVTGDQPILIKDMGDKVAIKKLWRACKETATAQQKAASSVDIVDSPIPKETSEDIKQVWSSTHNFVLPEDWLLVETLQGKLWRGATASPPRVDAILAESLRPLSCASRAMGAQLAVVPGKAVETQAVVIDNVTRPFELYVRCRAWFCTMAYVSIRNRSWFDYQAALFGSDKVLSFVTQTFQGQHAPTSFYAAAWAATVHYFAEMVRLNGASLKDAVRNTGQWEHRWTNWSPPARVSGHEGGGGGGCGSRSSNPDLPRNVLEEIQRLKSSARQWQASADHYRSKLENATSSKGNNKGGNKGSKGSKSGDGSRRDYDDKGKHADVPALKRRR